MSHVLGIDVSTTATKALVIDPAGQVIGAAHSRYDYETPAPQWSEQDPDLWWFAAREAVPRALQEAGISAADVIAIGLTGQMHGSVLLDGEGVPVRPAILWNDQRTSAECDEIRQTLGDELVRITGNDAIPGFTLPKLLWVRNNEPAVWQRVASVCLPKDYLRYRMTGALATDLADGSGTLLVDLAERTWSDHVTTAMGLDPGLLPPIYEGDEITGSVTGDAAEELGLAPGTPVVAGGGDQAANAVGLGAIEPGLLALSLGTSGVVFAPTNEPISEPAGQLQAFCHALPGAWHLMGVMLSAAGSLRWYRDTLAPDLTFEDLDHEAATVEAGSEDLLFLPYLTGERAPHVDPLARGAFVGLTVRHKRAHMTRAVLEGVAFGLRDTLDRMTTTGVAIPERFLASGGGIASPLWSQILADVLGAEIASPSTNEGAAYGAGLLAGKTAGWAESTHEVVTSVTGSQLVASPGSDAARYAELLPLYKGLYAALRPSFHRMG